MEEQERALVDSAFGLLRACGIQADGNPASASREAE
jgi:hypothetical protein